MPILIGQCPSCGGSLEVRRLWCEKCQVSVEGSFTLGTLARLRPEEQEFVVAFVKASGSLKEMAQRFKVSYPTVRRGLNELIARLEELEQEGEEDGR
jgi:hypothetical protein